MKVVLLGERLRKKRKMKMKREPGGSKSLERECKVVKMKNEGVFKGEGPWPLYGLR